MTVVFAILGEADPEASAGQVFWFYFSWLVLLTCEKHTGSHPVIFLRFKIKCSGLSGACRNFGRLGLNISLVQASFKLMVFDFLFCQEMKSNIGWEVLLMAGPLLHHLHQRLIGHSMA